MRIAAPAAGMMLAMVLLLCWPSVSLAGKRERAAQPYALIIGTVYGPDNLPAYGVKVKIRDSQKKKAHWETYSNHQGEFAVRVPAGAADYLVTAEPPAKSAGGVEITVHVDSDERKDVGLHLTAAQHT